MRNRYIIILLAIMFFGACSPTKSGKASMETESPPDEKILSGLLNDFFKKYKEHGSAVAVDFVFGSGSGIDSSQIVELKSKLLKLSESAGKFVGYEQITKQRAGNSLVYYSYLVKHELQPIRFIFIFYKANETWRIYKFKFDDQVENELEEAGKLYFIK